MRVSSLLRNYKDIVQSGSDVSIYKVCFDVITASAKPSGQGKIQQKASKTYHSTEEKILRNLSYSKNRTSTNGQALAKVFFGSSNFQCHTSCDNLVPVLIERLQEMKYHPGVCWVKVGDGS